MTGWPALPSWLADPRALGACTMLYLAALANLVATFGRPYGWLDIASAWALVAAAGLTLHASITARRRSGHRMPFDP